MSGANDSAHAVGAAHDDLGGRVPDPALLRVIHRVAHRAHLHEVRPAGATTPRSISTRRRPVTVSDVRPARGTTARKVTWSR